MLWMVDRISPITFHYLASFYTSSMDMPRWVGNRKQLYQRSRNGKVPLCECGKNRQQSIQSLVAEAVESRGIMLVNSAAFAQLHQRPDALVQTTESRIHDLHRGVELHPTDTGGTDHCIICHLHEAVLVTEAFTQLVCAYGTVYNYGYDSTSATNILP